MPRCNAITLRGTHCRVNAIRGYQRCGNHMNGDRIQTAEQLRETRQAGVVWNVIMHMMEDGRTMDELAMALDMFHDIGTINGVWVRNLARRLALLELNRDLMPEFEAVLIPDQRRHNTLAALSHDEQNVHRSVVSDQTNRYTDILLKTKVPKTQDTLAEIRNAWDKPKRILTMDVKKWYTQNHCRNPNDQLYKRVLDGLWYHVQHSDFKAELIKRLQEECTDAIGMCCEGHISRLCNVLVGFDDRFTAEAPMGQIIQERIAKISELDVSAEEKALEAWKILEELRVPEEDRRAWIDAL
jgi:hypothetical protein